MGAEKLPVEMPETFDSMRISSFFQNPSFTDSGIPKGRSMVNYSQEDIDYFADIINGLPRKILSYKTPDELFDRELDLIYSTQAA